jgi:hypothetical protein
MTTSPPITKTQANENTRYDFLKIIALLFFSRFWYFEIRSAWLAVRISEKIFSFTEIISATLYIALFLAGLIFLLPGLWRPDMLNRRSRDFEMPILLRWSIATGLVVLFTYTCLYSPWQNKLPGPWSQLIFAAGLTQIILFFTAPQKAQVFGWHELSLALVLFLFPRVAQEARSLFLDAAAYRMVTIAGFATVMVVIFLLYSSHGEEIRHRMIAWRGKMGSVRFGLAGVLCLTPIFHRYLVTPEIYILNADTRFTILLVALWGIAYLASNGSSRLISQESLGIVTGILIFTSFLAASSLLIIDYPFSLYWSEGNRFYDYSLMFGQSLYEYDGYVVNPYDSPGRYGLWGILFLWQGLPIWVHRLWNLILHTLPVLIFSTLLTRKLEPPAMRHGMLLWISLFLMLLAPLHPPFIVVSVIMVTFAFEKSSVIRGASTVIAGCYVAFTRFTWAFAPGAIGMLVDLLLYYPSRQGSRFRRLVPTIAIMILGILPGLLSNLGTFQSTLLNTLYSVLPDPGTVQSTIQGESLTAQQPLLWYRLLPNETLGIGVLFLALYYTLPILLILAWLMLSGRWRLDWVQKSAIWGILLGFFSFGLLISTKIGGGGDLHNLDMYLITLLVVVVLGLMLQTNNSGEVRLPVWVMGMALFLIFLPIYLFSPFYPNARHSSRLDLPGDYQVAETLSKVQQKVKEYAALGEVLFMDQRQLLTFGYIPDVAFVPEYEKKYLMDQAMANNAEYFHSYYEDLARQRFTLIVTEPLRAEFKDETGGPFTEENDAWVLWVSNPTLCFYESIYLSKRTNLQLLVPKQDPIGCEQYIK